MDPAQAVVPFSTSETLQSERISCAHVSGGTSKEKNGVFAKAKPQVCIKMRLPIRKLPKFNRTSSKWSQWQGPRKATAADRSSSEGKSPVTCMGPLQARFTIQTALDHVAKFTASRVRSETTIFSSVEADPDSLRSGLLDGSTTRMSTMSAQNSGVRCSRRLRGLEP